MPFNLPCYIAVATNFRDDNIFVGDKEVGKYTEPFPERRVTGKKFGTLMEYMKNILTDYFTYDIIGTTFTVYCIIN